MNLLIVWFVVPPLFYAIGWVTARVDLRAVLNQAKKTPTRIFNALDGLVDNKTGKSTEELRDVIEDNPQMIELALSLGKLYRKRGENDLAIKLHTKLLTSQFVLGIEQKDEISLELAKDFQMAGLVDRAEGLLLELMSSKMHSQEASSMLLNIYQQDKNWLEAIELAKKLARNDHAYHIEVAEFYCEIAQEHLIKSNYNEAINYVELALSTNRKCVRANIILGDIHYLNDNIDQAIDAWLTVEKQNYLYIPMIIERIFQVYAYKNHTKQAIALFIGYSKLYAQLNMIDFLYGKVLQFEGSAAAIKLIRDILANQPNGRVAAKLIEAHLLNKSDTEILSDANVIRGILLKYSEKLSAYKCSYCNFKSKTFFWKCPACYQWESINPNFLEV